MNKAYLLGLCTVALLLFSSAASAAWYGWEYRVEDSRDCTTYSCYLDSYHSFSDYARYDNYNYQYGYSSNPTYYDYGYPEYAPKPYYPNLYNSLYTPPSFYYREAPYYTAPYLRYTENTGKYSLYGQ